MRRIFTTIILITLLSCDESRVYEQQVDFDKSWIVTNKPAFNFEIADHTQSYNIYCTVRNSLDFPYSRIFISYTLEDSLGTELKKDLASAYLFDQKSGEPMGSSGLGDLYDHRLPLLSNYSFEKPGVYTLKYEQFNRRDTLEGVLAVGVRVERVIKQ